MADSSLEKRLTRFEVVQDQILEQTKKTNGRVDKLESEREGMQHSLIRLSDQVQLLVKTHEKQSSTIARLGEKLLIGLIVVGATVLANLWTEYQQNIGANKQITSLKKGLSQGDFVLEIVE